MDFQNNQNAHKQHGLLGAQSQHLREAIVEVKAIPLPPDKAMSIPAEVNEPSPYLGFLRKI